MIVRMLLVLPANNQHNYSTSLCKQIYDFQEYFLQRNLIFQFISCNNNYDWKDVACMTATCMWYRKVTMTLNTRAVRKKKKRKLREIYFVNSTVYTDCALISLSKWVQHQNSIEPTATVCCAVLSLQSIVISTGQTKIMKGGNSCQFCKVTFPFLKNNLCF